MTKIAHVCTSAISHKILADKLELLRQAGYDVHLVSSRDGYDPRMTEATGLKLHFVPMDRRIRPWADLRSVLSLRKLFREMKFDVVHTHTAKAGVLGRIAAWTARVPTIVHTSHGLPFYEGQSPKAYRLYRELERVGARFCHALSSQNREDIAKLQELAPRKPVYWEGNGIDLDKLTEAKERVGERSLSLLRTAYGIPEGRRVLLMGARFEPVKNHGLLLDALDRLNRLGRLDFTTLLAGTGPLESEIKARISTLGLTERVLLIGHQSPLHDHLLLADAVALTSEKEGIPRIVMEAMAFGRPVIATDALGTRELVSPERTGMLVPLERPDLLAESLERLMGDADLRERMGAEARRVVEAEFTERIVVERLCRLYAELDPANASSLRRRGARRRAFAKRLTDLAVSVPALLFLLPTLLIVAGLVRWKLGSPVLFKQERPGLYGKPFKVYKFRTMTDRRDASGELLPDADRLTAFGRLLRKLSLDELPQLLNVVKGDMSLVGPRPLLMEYLSLYTPEQARRHHLRPGITGWAQVNGRNAVSWEEKFRLDVDYVDKQTVTLDLKILLLTVLKVVRREGIAQEGHATVSKFTGSREMEMSS
ncbi:sugar transferase [Cohnella nanjingensis]|uniref:Sugar transferase n=1 Tax=Cohnella nanjingensis TaxID=1387779 RepID=A0A7X0VI46_9BACL|nr:sugar transferase [Cohnella nanjingensis]